MNFKIEIDIFEIIILVINIMLIILYVLNCIKLSKLRKNYASFMTKLGKGENINEMLKGYIESMDAIKVENEEIIEYCKKLDEQSNNYLKKIGMVRYNAYKDTGSNLSFALAMLDNKNNGVVLNGIYARDNSNIYAKPVKEGKSEYVLSKEEEEAIKKAVENKR